LYENNFGVEDMAMKCGRRPLLFGTIAALSARVSPATASSRDVTIKSADALGDEERQRHERYMQMAIDVPGGGPPFGAVIVDNDSGNVMCHGRNPGSRNRIYHGEMVAMINCGDEHPQVDWSRLTLYTTGEPCPMCMSAIIWNRIPKVVYATSIQKLTNIGLNQIGLDTPTVAGAAPFYSGEIISGILQTKTDKLFEEWWASRRR
jgi:tRNA(adenine34) deaminase